MDFCAVCHKPGQAVEDVCSATADEDCLIFFFDGEARREAPRGPYCHAHWNELQEGLSFNEPWRYGPNRCSRCGRESNGRLAYCVDCIAGFFSGMMESPPPITR